MLCFIQQIFALLLWLIHYSCHVIRHVGGAAASKPELFFRGKKS